MAFFAQLQSQLKSRKEYVDAASDISTGRGEGTRATDGKSFGSSKFLSFNDFKDKSKTGYCGLLNQGATCYLNSVLQALYLTHSFRRAVYQWRYDPNLHPPIQQCPVAQLQILFAKMQLSERAAISTTPLTKSFGWNDGEIFAQQDVQEMMSALMTNLEESGLGYCIRRDFTGTYTSYIDFVGTPHAREHEESFRNVQLAIKGVKSIEDALLNFIEPELMDGENMVYCEALGRKAEAHKGLRFARLPAVLVLQLKRFEMDWQRMCQVKLSDDVSIPLTLDPCELGILPSSESKGDTAEANESQSSIFDLYAVLVHSGSAMGGHYFSYMRDLFSLDERTTGIKEKGNRVEATLGADSDKSNKIAESDQGTVNGKETTGWLDFNDSNVSELSPESLHRVMDVDDPGHKVKLPSGSNVKKCTGSHRLVKSSSNAYMLMYRRRESMAKTSLPIAGPVRDSEIPDRVAEEVRSDNYKFLANKADFQKERDTYSLRVFRKHKPGYKVVKVNCNTSLSEATRVVHQKIHEGLPASSVKLDCVRLRHYDTLRNVATSPLDPSNNDLSLKEANVTRNCPLLLEERGEDETFSPWTHNSVALKVRLFKSLNDNGESCYGEPVQIDIANIDLTTVGDLRRSIATALNIRGGSKHCQMIIPHVSSGATAASKQGIYKEMLNTATTSVHRERRHIVLSDDSERLGVLSQSNDGSTGLNLMQGTEILVEECDIHYAAEIVDESTSNIIRELEHVAASVTIKFNAPGEDTPSLEISIDSRLRLKELKEAIASHDRMIKEGLSKTSMFKIRRTASSEEWKDLNLTMTQQGIRDKSSIYVEKGIPLLPSQVSIKVNSYGASFDKYADMCEKNLTGLKLIAKEQCQQLWYFVGSLIVEKSISIPDLKQTIIDKLIKELRKDEASNEEYSPSRIRLRECNSNKLTTLLHDEGTLASCVSHLSDDTQIAFQELDHVEALGSSALVVSLTQWHPKEQVLEPKFPYKELVIPHSSWTVNNLIEIISDNTDIETDLLSLAKPFSWELNDLKMLPNLNWDKFSKTANLVTDLRIKDGDVLIFKDRSIPDMPDLKAATSVDKPAIFGGTSGIKIYSYAEQLARAASEKELETKPQESQDSER